MQVADLHIHSKYSRATSRECDAPHLDLWARRKGISLLGAGDCTHAGWREELHHMLRPAEDGLYTLREEFLLPEIPAGETPRFVISGEISSIYKKDGKTRRVHNIVLLPGLEEAETLSQKLEKIGNIHADGRPILKLDCRDLAEMTMDVSAKAMVIPAHIWTPHFSVLGNFSDFTSIEDCFGDMTSHIHALETGLSSDPEMNGRLSMLDRFTLISNSDAHSPAKLGREANLLDIDLSYSALFRALSGLDSDKFAGTIEFFPEDGKYHLDGHRNCGVCLTPSQTLEHKGRCPVCGGKLTIGVLHRLESLADRTADAVKRPFESLAPLTEVLSSCMDVSPASVHVEREYHRLIQTLGPELYILREASLSDLALAGGERLSEGLRRLRNGEIIRKPGFDGQYGSIELFSSDEIQQANPQISLFSAVSSKHAETSSNPLHSIQLNEAQQRAVHTTARVTMVNGTVDTGKTEAIISRIVYMISTLGIRPSQITVITATNRAADHLKSRISALLGGKHFIRSLTAGTLTHLAWARRKKRDPEAYLLASDQCHAFGAAAVKESGFSGSTSEFLHAVHLLKNGKSEESAHILSEQAAIYDWYIRTENAIDLDDLVLDEIEHANSQKHGRKKIMHVLVDDFQMLEEAAQRLVFAWSAQGTLFATSNPLLSRSEPAAVLMSDQLPAFLSVPLTLSYSATPSILQCAQKVINAERIPEFFTNNEQKVRIVETTSLRDEAGFIARDIAALTSTIKGHQSQPSAHSFNQIVVLCRTARQLDLLQRTLDRAGLPCAITIHRDDFCAPQIHTVLSLMRFIADSNDLLSLRSYLRASMKVSATRVEKLMKSITTGTTPNLTAEEDAALKKLNDLCNLYRSTNPVSFLHEYAEMNHLTHHANFTNFIKFAASYAKFDDLLFDVLIQQNGDLRRHETSPKSKSYITLGTFEDAPYFSFDLAYLCGMTLGYVPLENTTHSTANFEQQLLYSAMTCAKRQLTITFQEPASLFLESFPDAFTLYERKSNPPSSANRVQLSMF